MSNKPIKLFEREKYGEKLVLVAAINDVINPRKVNLGGACERL